MATALSLSFSLDPQPHTKYFKYKATPFLNPKQTNPLFISPKLKSRPYSLILSSSNSPSPTLVDPPRTGRFLSNEDLEKLQFLQDFKYFQELQSGYLLIRVMKEEEMDMIVGLLSESFAESMLLPLGYVNLLGMLVKQYMRERRALMPHTATLIGFYKREKEGDEDIELAGTVDISFDKMGANTSPPTPTPPRDSPYICNMTVTKTLRRRGIGWHLLKASEELISQMSSSRDIYLHCRIIDIAPFNMYTKAGYGIVKTDSIFILLTLQRRKHLMRKQLPTVKSPSETDGSYSNEELPS